MIQEIRRHDIVVSPGTVSVDVAMSEMGDSRPMHSVPVPINVRCYSNSDIIVRRSEVTLRAMCGRLRVGKDFLHECSIGRYSHVFGLCVRFT
jgi:hypothetical protein